MTFDIGGVNVGTIYENITKAGVSRIDAQQIVGEWLIGVHSHAARQFDYQTAFPATETDCQPHFVRSFHHVDWHDGQDLVQAEQGGGEDGFNLRLHRIENDLDALGADNAELFLCLAEMRQSLRHVLDEIRLELNRINSDLQECCSDGPDRVVVDPSRGRWGKYVGSSNFFGKKVNVFTDTMGQLFITPSIHVLPGGGVTDPPNERIDKTIALGHYMAESKKVQALFRKGPVLKEDFVKSFGDDLTSDGHRIGDLVDILPQGARYASVDTFMTAVVEREGAAIRTSGAADAAVFGSFDIGTEVTNVAQAPVESYTLVSEEARAALVTSGISTVGDLARMSAGQLQKMLVKGGVEVSLGEAAGMLAGAKTMTNVR